MRRRPEVMRADRGSVLLETAIAVPVLIAIAIAMVWVVSLGAVYVRALDTAQTAARQVARGVPVEAIVDPGGSAKPPLSGVTITTDAGLVHARVTRRITAPGPLLGGLGFDITAEATALAETAVAP